MTRPRTSGAGLCALSCASFLTPACGAPAEWSTVAAEDGAFGIEGVPPGTYTMTVWSRDAALRSERTIEVAAGRTDLGALGG